MSGRLRRRAATLAASLALALVVAGCAGWEPFEPELPREIPDGPGLLTGSEGAFVIERPIRPDPEESSDEVADEEEERALRPEAGRP